jgi:GDP-L-fucose synthase
MIKNIIGFEGEIIWDLSKPDGTPRKLILAKYYEARGQNQLILQ